jgi:hypothetical protein
MLRVLLWRKEKRLAISNDNYEEKTCRTEDNEPAKETYFDTVNVVKQRSVRLAVINELRRSFTCMSKCTYMP